MNTFAGTTYDRDGLPVGQNTPFLQRRLHRSTTDSMVAGVLGGFAETYGWNVTLLRIAFLASFLLPGPQAIFYFIAWLVMPRGI